MTRWLVDWHLTILSTQIRSYCAFKVTGYFEVKLYFIFKKGKSSVQYLKTNKIYKLMLFSINVFMAAL